MAEEGVEVAVCARTVAKLKATAAEITEALGVRVVPIPADVRTNEGCRHFVQSAAETLGRIDMLINNAGASPFAPFVDLSDEAFVDTINSKLLGYVRCARAAIPYLQEQGAGCIINITGGTQQGVVLHAAGGTCNAGTRMFSKILTLALGQFGIRVNGLALGSIETRRAVRIREARAKAEGTSPDAGLANLIKRIPSGRTGTVEDNTRVDCFVVSEQASYINGAAISVDGSQSVVLSAGSVGPTDEATVPLDCAVLARSERVHRRKRPLIV